MQEIFLGIDGCKAGWAVVEIRCNSSAESWHFYILSKIKELLDKYSFPLIKSPEANRNTINPIKTKKQSEASLILIDIPIGLKESGPEERKCDILARKLLGPKRGSSVFRVPVRSTVYFEESYEQASLINYNLTGKKISKQTWHICKKIREVDELITITKLKSISASIIHESHPEAAFKSLKNTPLLYSKKSKEGLNERINIIRTYSNLIDTFLDGVYKKFKKSEVQPDDILDAAALAISAKKIYKTGKIIKLPEENEFDSRKLRMEIVF
ncbi:MAG: DUF429 domain-containing protein [Actinobacteria bacterium]|nr:DUF429 domain-containing protein [Actinomycetota bacterium]